MITIGSLINDTAEKLNECGCDEAAEDLSLIMEDIYKCSRSWLIIHKRDEIGEEQKKKFEAMAERLMKHEPVSYVLGNRHFYGLCFEVNENVLIPRQDTEHLVEAALEFIRKRAEETGQKVRILDLCTGSGCIGITVKYYMDREGIPGEIVCSDISEEALRVAEKNAVNNGIKAEFLQSDLFAGVEGSFDLILSNPPYIPKVQMEELDAKVSEYEPHLALYGGVDGLDFYRRIVSDSGDFIKNGGALYMEIGFDQGESVPALLIDKGFVNIEVLKDYSGHDRVVKARVRRK